ncbi:hypothetical protein MHYP_G00177320 [Metynnis hypsauchen]
MAVVLEPLFKIILVEWDSSSQRRLDYRCQLHIREPAWLKTTGEEAGKVPSIKCFLPPLELLAEQCKSISRAALLDLKWPAGLKAATSPA